MKTPAGSLVKSAISGVPGILAVLSVCMSMQVAAQAADPPAPVSSPNPDINRTADPVQRYAASDVKRAFSFMDSNHDGQLSPAEAAGFKNVARHFAAADANKDGMLSPSEFDAALNGHRVQ